MRTGYYDPVIGRFYSNAPVGFTNIHTFNRYTYANNNPYKYTVPDGNSPVHALRFVADVEFASLNYAETGFVNFRGAVADAAVGVLNLAKTLHKAKRLANVIKGGCTFIPDTLILITDGY